MIKNEVPQHLGRKTLILMFIQGVLPGVILFLLVIVLSFIKPSLFYDLNNKLITTNEIVSIISNNLPDINSLLIPATFFLAVILSGLGIIINILRYHFFVFTLEEFSLKLRKGILNVEEISIPYRQIQNVDITRPFIYRLIGLSRLVIVSAGNEQSLDGDQVDTVFDPIDYEIAEEIREILDRRIGVQIIEHESEANKKEAESMLKQ